MLFYALHYFLDDHDMIESDEFEIPEHMSKGTAQTVLELVCYFSKQRAILNKVHAVIVRLFTLTRALFKSDISKCNFESVYYPRV